MKSAAVMIGIATLFLAGAANATPSICDADPNNIVLNCGFEANGGTFNNWTPAGPGFAVLTGGAHSGNWDALLAVAGTQGASIDLSQTLGVTDDEQYSVSFYLKRITDGNSNQSFTASIDGLHGVLGQFSLSGMQSGYSDYTKENFDFIADSASAKLDFNLTDSNAFADWEVDDVEVDPQAVPEPSSLALFSAAFLGLAGLAAFGRRRRLNVKPL
jgi:hypothetical protein